MIFRIILLPCHILKFYDLFYKPLSGSVGLHFLPDKQWQKKEIKAVVSLFLWTFGVGVEFQRVNTQYTSVYLLSMYSWCPARISYRDFLQLLVTFLETTQLLMP